MAALHSIGSNPDKCIKNQVMDIPPNTPPKLDT